MAKKPTTEDIFYDHLTLGLMGTLAKIPRVRNVSCEHRKPCEKAQVVNWEQRHTVYLPEDMKKFYLSTDGFLLQWSYQYAPNDLRRVGYIHLPHLQQITLLRENFESSISLGTTGPPSSSSRTIPPATSSTTNLLEIESHETTTIDGISGAFGGLGVVADNINGEIDGVGIHGGAGSSAVPLAVGKDRWGNLEPVITTKTKIFELNTINDVAKVCMVYESSGSNNPKFYLLELNAMKWIFLSDTFSEYLRMAIAHLGLPYWELCFSNIGLPSWTEQLFMLLAPHLLEDFEPRRERQVDPAPEHPYNIIDTSVFRIKPKSSIKAVSSKKNVM
ncbi:tubulin polyglutamylase complex subunit 2-like [Rhagoletis pomonella]|uniref:tubulin polyglutamylase complex subunit 2-like n=1 Tax=Rhagoletis pomonella TaxID=28610 RepID=UPI001784D1D8|nr:tubulin polyglutamylase complex subunit 2-like [Rhagoletis pomonella]